tara:strand:+ start:171 stop:311 length:141 start_codon:yes stop_codon:yes gene_type:complete
VIIACVHLLGEKNGRKTGMMSNTAQNDAVKRVLAILELLNFRVNKY